MQTFIEVCFVIAMAFIWLGTEFIICISCVVMDAPIWLTIAYFAWIICSILSIALSKSKDLIDKMVVPTFITIVLTCLFLGHMCTQYSTEDDAILWLVGPALNLPVFNFIGKRLGVKIDEERNRRLQQYNDGIKTQINQKKQLQIIEEKIKNDMVIMHFISILDCCGGDTAKLRSHPKIDKIEQLNHEICGMENDIKLLESKMK